MQVFGLPGQIIGAGKVAPRIAAQSSNNEAMRRATVTRWRRAMADGLTSEQAAQGPRRNHMRFGRVLAAIVMLAATLTQAAQASCTQAQLAGVWKAYSAGVDRGISYWTSCFIVINSGGFIANTTSVNSVNLNGNLANGRIVLGNANQRAYFGEFTFNGARNILRNMALARDKLTPAWACSRRVFHFTMTRI